MQGIGIAFLKGKQAPRIHARVMGASEASEASEASAPAPGRGVCTALRSLVVGWITPVYDEITRTKYLVRSGNNAGSLRSCSPFASQIGGCHAT